jgi:hypothetical protein
VGRRTVEAVGEATSCGVPQEAVSKRSTTSKKKNPFIGIILLLLEENRGRRDFRLFIGDRGFISTEVRRW